MKGKTKLDLELFTRVSDDIEKRQYIILAELKTITDEFKLYKIYPGLSFLVELRKILTNVIQRLTDLRSQFPKRIEKIDFVNRTIHERVVFVEGDDIAGVIELIEWALPHIEKTIDEGAAIHQFVAEELLLEEVGILPNYRDEGYFFIPDNRKNRLNLFRFELSIFQSADDQYRSLKTRFLKTVQNTTIKPSPNSIKLELINEQKELPNPATYSFDTTLDFPFRQTILPVAKRKLIEAVSI